MSASSSSAAPHVVILGCGYAGGLLAHALDAAAKAGKIKLTVIDRRNVLNLKIGSIRASVYGGKWAERTLIPIADITKYGKCVVGEVERVDADTNTIYFKESATTAAAPAPLTFDVLVCATGTLNHSPGDLNDDLQTPEEIRQYFTDISAAFDKANDVLVVGGGASAVEYAGEIRAKFPKKKITIVCSSANLLTSSVAPLSAKFLRRVYEKLDMLNITLIREEKVVHPTELNFGKRKWQSDCTIKTVGKQNLTIKTDLLIWASSWAKDADVFPALWLNEIGELNIANTFQLIERGDVFAIGDVCSLSETKQAVTLPAKMKLIAHNVLQVAQAKQQQAKIDHTLRGLRTYAVNDRAEMYLPVGPKVGVSQYRGFVFGDRKTSQWKGRDLYTTMFWKLLTSSGQCPPTPALA